MPGVQTYTLIQEQTLSSSAASVSFSSIPQIYEDLVLEVVGKSISTDTNFRVQFNGDTGNNYSHTEVYGSGSTAASTRTSGVSGIQIGWTTTGTDSVVLTNIQSYSNPNVNKTTVGTYSGSSSYVAGTVGLWRSTAAITSILVYMQNGNNIASGCSLRLYGVVA